MYTSTGQLDRNALLKQYQPLVARLAGKIMGRVPANIEIDDLIQVGMIGLLDAMTRYEVGKGVSFEAFVSQRIQGAMIDELRSNDTISRGLRKNQKEISASTLKLENLLSRKPMASEIAKDLGLPLEEYQSLVANIHNTQTFYFEDMTGDEDSDSYLDRHMSDKDSDPCTILSTQRMRSKLIEEIKRLPDRSQMIMSLYYEQDMTLKEIAMVLTLTESRVCQLMNEITLNLKKKMKNH